MLLQTNSYVVPAEKRAEHAKLMQRFKQTLARFGCDGFEVFEQVGPQWQGEGGGRFVQIISFNDRRHQQDVQNAERSDPAAQELIRDFCALIDFSHQQAQGLFASGYYNSVLGGTGLARSHVPSRVPPRALHSPRPPSQGAIAAIAPAAIPLPPAEEEADMDELLDIVEGGEHEALPPVARVDDELDIEPEPEAEVVEHDVVAEHEPVSTGEPVETELIDDEPLEAGPINTARADSSDTATELLAEEDDAFVLPGSDEEDPDDAFAAFLREDGEDDAPLDDLAPDFGDDVDASTRRKE